MLCTGCITDAEKVSMELSDEADSFNTIRRLTVVNCISNDVIFQMTGNLSITVDTAENQLEIVVYLGDDIYKKHFVGLSDNVTYAIEDITNESNIKSNNYSFQLNPNFWIAEESDKSDDSTNQ